MQDNRLAKIMNTQSTWVCKKLVLYGLKGLGKKNKERWSYLNILDWKGCYFPSITNKQVMCSIVYPFYILQLSMTMTFWFFGAFDLKMGNDDLQHSNI
jgi:hypothetical protein